MIGGSTRGATARLSRFAADAEAAGATALWGCDHLFWHQPLLEPLTSLAVAASATESVTLGTCVLQLPLRSPAAVARQVATLQSLSGGRFVLGLGVGSHRGEYQAAGVDFDRRGALLDEGVAALREAWQTAGRTDTRYRQEPAVGAVPLWFAGNSEPARRRVASEGDGWVPMFLPPEEYRRARVRVLEAVSAAGRRSEEVTTAVVVMLCVGDSEEVARKEGTSWLSDLYLLPPKAFERHLVAGPVEDCAAELVGYQAAGAEHVVVMVAGDDPLDHLGPVLEALPRPGTPDPHPPTEPNDRRGHAL